MGLWNYLKDRKGPVLNWKESGEIVVHAQGVPESHLDRLVETYGHRHVQAGTQGINTVRSTKLYEKCIPLPNSWHIIKVGMDSSSEARPTEDLGRKRGKTIFVGFLIFFCMCVFVVFK